MPASRTGFRSRLGPARAVALAVAAALGACAEGGSYPSGGPVDFVIGGIPVHLSSGGWLAPAGVLTLYLTDQTDTCLAIALVPVGTAVTISLRVVPEADGTTRATVVAPQPTVGAGEAVGGLVRATGGVPNAILEAVDGTVAWTVNADGSITVTSIDVAFAGGGDRLRTGGLRLPRC